MKKLFSILLSLCLLCGTFTAFAAEDTNNTETAETISETQAMADALNLLGLFRGTDLGYELDRALNRAEALTLVVRMVGAEEEALAGGYATPTPTSPLGQPLRGLRLYNGHHQGCQQRPLRRGRIW